jgi:hypothetical protein
MQSRRYPVGAAACESGSTGQVVDDRLDFQIDVFGCRRPSISLYGRLTGAVSTPTSPIDATVNVLQSLSSGVTIQVAGSLVDSVTGKYSYAVPVNAPLVAPYVTGSGTLVFTSANTVAGKYQLAATSGAATKTSAPPILAPGAVVTTNFAFP